VDPASDEMIPFADPSTGEQLAPVDDTLESDGGGRYPIVDGIARFVETESYAAGFGLEWTLHSETQLDSRTGRTVSRQRLERCIGASVSSLRGLRILEVGCGAGRFTELLVAGGALVHAIDLSRAVDVNRANIGPAPNYRVAQADLLAAPFPDGSFDYVICLGVLQHTPSPEESIRALWRKLRLGGTLVVDHYTWSLSRATKLDSLLRPIIKRLPPPAAKSITDFLVRIFFPLHWAVRNSRPTIGGVPLLQMMLSRVSPASWNYRVSPHLPKHYHYESSRLDTFDHLADRYKRLRTRGQIRKALASLGAVEIEVWKGGNGIEARCRKPAPPSSASASIVRGSSTHAGTSTPGSTTAPEDARSGARVSATERQHRRRPFACRGCRD
jgi:SAM-dependent methyltransferase